MSMGFDFNRIVPILPSCCSFSFVLICRVSFFGRFQHPPINGCSAVSGDFGVLAEDEHKVWM